MLSVTPAGFGEPRTVQLEPSHCSVNVSRWPAVPLKYSPTAMHEVTDAHETPNSTFVDVDDRLGEDCSVQLEPSQRSARVTEWLVLFEVPTAVQAVDEAHETELSWASVGDGLGVVRSVQLVPSHVSATVCCIPLELVVVPTAAHDGAVVHDTPLRFVLSAPDRLGVVWIDQLMPFQPSASVSCVTLEEAVSPTPSHELADVHETARTSLTCLPATPGAAWVVQVVPFHCSMSGALEMSSGEPAATHSLAVGHETLLKLGEPDTGLVVVCWDQLAPSHRSARVRFEKVPEVA
jgi:hypothetical protein